MSEWSESLGDWRRRRERGRGGAESVTGGGGGGAPCTVPQSSVLLLICRASGGEGERETVAVEVETSVEERRLRACFAGEEAWSCYNHLKKPPTTCTRSMALFTYVNPLPHYLHLNAMQLDSFHVQRRTWPDRQRLMTQRLTTASGATGRHGQKHRVIYRAHCNELPLNTGVLLYWLS